MDNSKLKALLENEIKLYEDDGINGWAEADRELCEYLGDEGFSKTILALIAENERLGRFENAYTEWSDKTEWVQASAEPRDLGKHRADVLKARIDQLRAQRDLLLEAAVLDAESIDTIRAECEALRKDGPRLAFLMQDIDGFMSGSLDRYDHTASVMAERENMAEPTPADELEGFRRCIDGAMTKEGQANG
ncbi:hypothetical protein [Pseudomonas paeninsulae]|uniref:hypothetical protein n=1 Tax=Pseudomonas paeninsulae TaxID=3110772 RepID=UPI002D7A3D06|nr:hypothetical protein [Pseudomonas sp. IT1137]